MRGTRRPYLAYVLQIRLVPVAVAVLALSACGTTVSGAQLASAGGSNGLTATTQSGSGSTSAPGGVGGPQTSALTGTPVTSAVGPGTASAAAAASASLPATVATSINPKLAPLRVGFETIEGGNAAVSAAFGTPVNFGDGQREVTAIVNDVNTHGGVGGRKILPFFAAWDVATKDPGRETTCRSLTEDDHSQVIITVINISESFVACAAKHGVPVINASFGSGDTDLYKEYGKYLYSPSLMSLNREETLVLSELHANGKASSSNKVGVIIDQTTDNVENRVYAETMNPLLTAWGVPHESYGVAQQSDISGAVLRFATDGVKTVVFAAPSGIIEVLFMTAANQQGYRPAYGLGDSTSPWFVSTAAPQAQVKNITGAGSLPLSNVQVAQYPTTPRERHCLNLIAKEGETNSDRHSSITATVYCEAIYELAAIGEHLPGNLTIGAFEAAFQAVGRTYQPVTTFATDFGTGRHDNASLYRLLGWQDACSCINYTSGLKPV